MGIKEPQSNKPLPSEPAQGDTHTWAGLFDALVGFPQYTVPVGDMTLAEYFEEFSPTIEDFCMSPIATSWAWDACIDATGCGGDGPPPEGNCEQIIVESCYDPSIDYVEYYSSTCNDYMNS